VRKSSAAAVPCTAAKLLTRDEARHIAAALSPFVEPKSGECRGRAQLPELCFLTARDLERLNKTVFSPGPIGSGPG
jgi:hypothetical protein